LGKGPFKCEKNGNFRGHTPLGEEKSQIGKGGRGRPENCVPKSDREVSGGKKHSVQTRGEEKSILQRKGKCFLGRSLNKNRFLGKKGDVPAHQKRRKLVNGRGGGDRLKGPRGNCTILPKRKRRCRRRGGYACRSKGKGMPE